MAHCYQGLRDVPVIIGGATFTPGSWVYADRDGVLVSDQELDMEKPKSS